MDQYLELPDLAASYQEAGKIINNAKVSVIYVDVIWQKLKRIERYLQEQSKEELSSALEASDAAA